MSRPARHDELKETFSGVDSDVLWDLYMADIVYVDPSDWGRVEIPDNIAMFRFIMKRMFPAESHSDE